MLSILLVSLFLNRYVQGSIALVPSKLHSIKAPFEGSQLQNVISTGDIEYGESSVKLARSIPHSKGAVWFSNPNSYADWQATFSFTIKGPDHGSDGMGFWYTRYPGKLGPVFGGPEKWSGLGVFIDGFDNDGKGNNPAIMGVLNQGDVNFRMDMDGEGQYFGGCVRNIRNTKQPVVVRVTYINKTIKVEIDDNGKPEKEEFMSCMERPNTDLPQGYFFGVSAGSGVVPDEFFLHYFNLFELKKGDASKSDSISSKENAASEAKAVPASVSSAELERLIKNMQSNINALVGPFHPQDRNLFKRLADLE
jgi:hypothetical protein